MWAELVAEKIPLNQNEIERLNYILQLYEAENMRLQQELQSKEAAYASQQQKQLDLEKARQDLVKKLRSVEGTLKFERIAAEGLTKKVGMMELDYNNAKEDNALLTSQFERNVKRVKELETTFNRDRSRLLRNMHENELLKRRVRELETQQSAAESDAVQARTDLLDKLQVIETLRAKTDTQQRTIKAQAEEMLNLTREVYHLRDRQQELCEIQSSNETSLEKYEHQVRGLQAEVYRMHREMMEISTTHSQRSNVFQSSLPSDRVNARLSESSHGDRRSHKLSNMFSASVSHSSSSLLSPLGSPGGLRQLPIDSMPSGDLHGNSSISTSSPTDHIGGSSFVGGGGESVGLSTESLNSESFRAMTASQRPYRQVPPPVSVISSASTPHRPIAMATKLDSGQMRGSSRAATTGPGQVLQNAGMQASSVSSKDSTHAIHTQPSTVSFAMDSHKTRPAAQSNRMQESLLSSKGSDMSMSSRLDKSGGKLTARSQLGSSGEEYTRNSITEELAGMSGKSRFVGRGLGLRQDNSGAQSAKISAKQVLKNIMDKYDASL